MFPRRLGGKVHWCPQWFEHREAVIRLEALWRTWELVRLDPGRGMATWLKEFDEHRQVLMGESGPFQACSEKEHNPAPTLPVEERRVKKADDVAPDEGGVVIEADRDFDRGNPEVPLSQLPGCVGGALDRLGSR